MAQKSGSKKIEAVSSEGAKSAVNQGRIFSILSIVFAGLSLAVFPILFGPAGVILGIIGYKKGDKKLATIGIILSAVLAIVSFLLAYWIIMKYYKV